MNKHNPLRDWQVERSLIRTVGRDLQRPECILAEPDGTLWSADARGGVMRINPDGTQLLVAQKIDGRFGASNAADKFILRGTLPNGLAFAVNGDILIANFGTDAIERMTRTGESRTLFTEIDGRPLGKVNFILRDSKHRIWVTVHTRRDPWTLCVRDKTPDGYIALLDERGIRVVADGFVGTNEIRMDGGGAPGQIRNDPCILKGSAAQRQQLCLRIGLCKEQHDGDVLGEWLVVHS